MLKIYGVPISVHTRKVIVVALAKDLPHEVVPVVPVIPDNPPANWRQLSPTGKIPALSDGDFTIADSAAICAYLERLSPEPPLYPQPARDYALALCLEQYAGTLFREVVHPLFHETVVHPKMRGVATDQKRVDDVLNKAMPETFGYLDRVAGESFLAGKLMSIADIAVASNLTNLPVHRLRPGSAPLSPFGRTLRSHRSTAGHARSAASRGGCRRVDGPA